MKEQKREVYNFLGNNFPIYTFQINGDTFSTTEVPTKMYQTNVTKIWSGYDKYSNMSESIKAGQSYNDVILQNLISMGIFKIDSVKKVYDLEINQPILTNEPMKFLTELETLFINEKRTNPFIGLFWKTENDILCEMDWLPIPNRKLEYSLNIHHAEENAYLVIYKHNGNGEITLYQSLIIGESEIFYSELESFAPQRILELLEILPNGIFQHVVTAWDLFFISRYQYFMGSHPYQDTLDPVEVTIQDKVRMLLIWLNGLQEFLTKIKELHKAGQTVVFTTQHNELNREHVSYNTTYTPEIRNEILSKKDKMKLYAIANDYFIEIKKDV